MHLIYLKCLSKIIMIQFICVYQNKEELNEIEITVNSCSQNQNNLIIVKF